MTKDQFECALYYSIKTCYVAQLDVAATVSTILNVFEFGNEVADSITRVVTNTYEEFDTVNIERHTVQ